MTLQDNVDTDSAVLPTVCPECGEGGYLEHIDLRHHVTTQSCRSCGARWESQID